MVGAHRQDDRFEYFQGAAYVFVRSGATWTQQQELTASDGAANDDFGWSVAVSGGMVLVGADRTRRIGSIQRKARPMCLLWRRLRQRWLQRLHR